MLIWILDSDQSALSNYRQILQGQAELQYFSSFRRAYETSRKDRVPDVILTELVLEDGDVLDQFTEYMESPLGRRPKIVISANDDLEAMRHADSLSIGYLTKPVKPNLLLFTIERIMTRCANCRPSAIQVANVFLDPTFRTVTDPKGGSVSLTTKEFQIISAMAAAPSGEVRKDQIFQKVWGGIKVSSKTLDVHIFNLRRKLVDIGCQLDFVPPDRYRMTLTGTERKIQFAPWAAHDIHTSI